MSGTIKVVVGGQFGSEGKGHLTAQLAERSQAGVVVIRVGGPNAGHTVWRGDEEFKLRHLPTPVAGTNKVIPALGAKSVIDPRVLREELARFPETTVIVDPAATILELGDVDVEDADNQMHRIGSTRKGIGAARVARVRRVARTAHDLWGKNGSELDPQIWCTEVAPIAHGRLREGGDVIVEGAQGFGLGLHTPYYPFTTSADCTAIDALADAKISPWASPVWDPSDLEVWMAVRPYPIRVAGTSGPLKYETTWAELGLPEERTTVTNKVRRVGRWDGQLVRQAVLASGGAPTVRLALMMADQIEPGIAGMTSDTDIAELVSSGKAPNLDQLLALVERDSGARVRALGTGPKTMAFGHFEEVPF